MKYNKYSKIILLVFNSYCTGNFNNSLQHRKMAGLGKCDFNYIQFSFMLTGAMRRVHSPRVINPHFTFVLCYLEQLTT